VKVHRLYVIYFSRFGKILYDIYGKMQVLAV
jgi:hypothetical protein